MTAASVCAVLVSFRPDAGAIRAAVAAVRPQVDALVVIDNASAGIGGMLAGEDLVLLPQRSNLGLAAAQNIGIAWARGHGHTHVLILDQDSLPAPGMVAALLSAWQDLPGRVGAAGPRFRDLREPRDAPFVRVAFPRSDKVWCDPASGYVQCDFLVGSGSMLPVAVLDDVGDMDGGLFIDNVDLEWSFRARALGYALYGVCAARMQHRLGGERRPVLGGRRQVIRHEPPRLYFMMRNRLALYRLPHTPRVWIAQDVPRVVAKLLIFGVLVGPRRSNVRFMLRGLADGLRGRSGPCPIDEQP